MSRMSGTGLLRIVSLTMKSHIKPLLISDLSLRIRQRRMSGAGRRERRAKRKSMAIMALKTHKNNYLYANRVLDLSCGQAVSFRTPVCVCMLNRDVPPAPVPRAPVAHAVAVLCVNHTRSLA